MEGPGGREGRNHAPSCSARRRCRCPIQVRTSRAARRPRRTDGRASFTLENSGGQARAGAGAGAPVCPALVRLTTAAAVRRARGAGNAASRTINATRIIDGRKEGKKEGGKEEEGEGASASSPIKAFSVAHCHHRTAPRRRRRQPQVNKLLVVLDWGRKIYLIAASTV